MRPKSGANIPMGGETCEKAWRIMKGGGSLKYAAQRLGVSPKRLDRSLWNWRAAVVGAESVPNAPLD